MRGHEAYSFQFELRYQLMAITKTEASDQNKKLPYQASTLRSSVNGTPTHAMQSTKMTVSHQRRPRSVGKANSSKFGRARFITGPQLLGGQLVRCSIGHVGD